MGVITKQKVGIKKQKPKKYFSFLCRNKKRDENKK